MVMPIIEPNRPNSYRELPGFSEKSYWQSMARAVHLLKNNVAEIPRYHDQRLRVVGLFGACFMLLLTIAIPIYKEGGLEAWQAKMADNYDYVFNFEEMSRLQYRKQYRTTDVTEDENIFVKEQLNGRIHDHRFIRRYSFYLFFGGFALGLLALPLFIPRRCPVRFDRNREIAYTWHKGKLYIADIGPMLGGLDAQLGSSRPGTPLFEKDKATGPVVLSMVEAGNPDNKRPFRIGLYPVCHAHQNIDIQLFIGAFMSKHLYDDTGRKTDWNSDWLNKLEKTGFYPLDFLRKQGQFTLAKKHNFDDAKTEAALLDYLTDPKTRDRGQPVWRR